MIIIGTFLASTGLNSDDLILHTEADELIRPDLLTFLKLYDGYPVEPIAFKVNTTEESKFVFLDLNVLKLKYFDLQFRWSVYGFWLPKPEKEWTYKVGAMSVGHLRSVYNGDLSQPLSQVVDAGKFDVKQRASKTQNGKRFSFCLKLFILVLFGIKI